MKNLIILALLIPILSFSQEEKVVSKRIDNRIKAKEDINNLHDGVLLVRLSTKKKSIAAMRKANRNKLADKTELNLRIRNQATITAFRNNFSFCPVYFFYSDYSKHVINNQLDNVVFLNDSLKPDSTIKVSNTKYYTAELGSVEPSLKKHSSSTSFENGKKSTTYYGGSEITITGLIIKNNKFEQLSSPFPYYTREFKGLPFQRVIYKMTHKMNLKLNRFYNN